MANFSTDFMYVQGIINKQQDVRLPDLVKFRSREFDVIALRFDWYLSSIAAVNAIAAQ